MNFTPGPWKVTPLTGYSFHLDPKAKSPDEHLANAKLIASAPELLTALIETLKECESNYTSEYETYPGQKFKFPEHDKIRKLIKRAGGKI